MRKSNRTPQRRHLLPFLHSCRLPSTTSRPLAPPKLHRYLIPPDPSIHRPHPPSVLRRQTMVSGLLISLFSKNTPLWRPPVTSQSSRRSSHCRIHSACRGSPETWRLRNDTNSNHARTTNKRTQLPVHYPSPMRRHHDRFYLPTPNRSKVPNRLLISQPHRPSCRRNPHPNPLRFHRRPNPNNCPRLNVLRLILPSQHQLRTHTQPNNNPGPRPSNSSSTDNNMMIYR